MEDLLSKLWPLIFGLAVWGSLLVELVKERRSRQWPTARAKQIEVAPESRFESTSRGWRWRSSNETDLALQFVVKDKEYVVRIDELASFSAGGGPIGRTSGLPPSFDVRYDPSDPENIYYRHAYSEFSKKTLVTLVALIGTSLIAFFLYKH